MTLRPAAARLALATTTIVGGLLLAPSAFAGPPALCGKSGCAALTISFGELGTLLEKVSTPAPPPPVGAYFKLRPAPSKKPIFVVPYGQRIFVKGGGGWRAFSRADAKTLVDAIGSVTAYDPPPFTGVKVGTVKNYDAATWSDVFGNVAPGGVPSGKGFAIKLLSPRDNPWSKSGFVYYPGKKTVVFGGKAYVLPKSLADLLKRDVPAKSSNEPNWELLAQGFVFLALFIVSLLQARWRRRESEPGQKRRRRLLGLVKIGTGVAFIALAVATVSHGHLIWYVIGGLVVVVLGVNDLLGREAVGRWFSVAPVIYVLAVYVVRRWG